MCRFFEDEAAPASCGRACGLKQSWEELWCCSAWIRLWWRGVGCFRDATDSCIGVEVISLDGRLKFVDDEAVGFLWPWGGVARGGVAGVRGE